MKIKIEIDEKHSDTEVIIRTKKITPEVEKLVTVLRAVNKQIGVRRCDETILLNTENILYIETVDRKTFVYTEAETFETDLKLYEIEQELTEHDFLRISKQAVVNIRMIKSLKAEINRKIRVTLKNDEQIIVSRMYADGLRKKLGLK